MFPGGPNIVKGTADVVGSGLLGMSIMLSFFGYFSHLTSPVCPNKVGKLEV